MALAAGALTTSRVRRRWPMPPEKPARLRSGLRQATPAHPFSERPVRKPQRPTARQEESTFLAKFTIPIPIWLELEKDRPVRPHSGFPFRNSDRLLRDRDRRFESLSLRK